MKTTNKTESVYVRTTLNECIEETELAVKKGLSEVVRLIVSSGAHIRFPKQYEPMLDAIEDFSRATSIFRLFDNSEQEH